jgi:hypothetical protein
MDTQFATGEQHDTVPIGKRREATYATRVVEAGWSGAAGGGDAEAESGILHFFLTSHRENGGFFILKR